MVPAWPVWRDEDLKKISAWFQADVDVLCAAERKLTEHEHTMSVFDSHVFRFQRNSFKMEGVFLTMAQSWLQWARSGYKGELSPELPQGNPMMTISALLKQEGKKISRPFATRS